MTTAARPTFDPARGKDNKAPSYQQPGQGTVDEIGDRERLKEELRKAEQEYFESKDAGGSASDRLITAPEEDDGKRQQLLQEAEKMAALDRDASDEENDSDESSSSRQVYQYFFSVIISCIGSLSDDDDDDDDDEDNTAELLATLQRIRKERAEEKERQEREKADEENAKREEEALTGNPLLQIGDEKRDFSVKRRWDDDVIFKNQARGLEDRPKKRFVNDMLRSDFHRRFLSKYVH
ncbi:hypothetical protein DFQ28_004914 [Apophysomyces sp. BC1034]|nr:hypothetical protein DFQ28_004914 [Apophysomyces sp. BC1034]